MAACYRCELSRVRCKGRNASQIQSSCSHAYALLPVLATAALPAGRRYSALNLSHAVPNTKGCCLLSLHAALSKSLPLPYFCSLLSSLFCFLSHIHHGEYAIGFTTSIIPLTTQWLGSSCRTTCKSEMVPVFYQITCWKNVTLLSAAWLHVLNWARL